MDSTEKALDGKPSNETLQQQQQQQQQQSSRTIRGAVGAGEKKKFNQKLPVVFRRVGTPDAAGTRQRNF